MESDPGRIENEKKLNQARSIKHHDHLLKAAHQHHKCKHLKVHLAQNNLFVEAFREPKNTYRIAQEKRPK